MRRNPMLYTLIALAAAYILLGLASNPGPPKSQLQLVIDLAADLAESSGARQAHGGSAWSELAPSMSEALARAPESSWDIIRVFLEADEPTHETKWRVFHLVLAGAKGIEQRVLASLRTWCENAPPPNQRTSNHPSYLVSLLLPVAMEDRNWGSPIAQFPDGREILVLAAEGGVGSLQSRDVARDLIVALPMAPEEKSRLALRIISGQPSSTVTDPLLAPLLNAGDVAILRATFEESLKDLHRYDPSQNIRPHFCAAATLAHLGDTASLPALRRLEAGLPPRVAGYAQWYVSMVELQHPPTRLVELIESDAALDPRRSGEATWALSRAVELGVDQQTIVDALQRSFARVRERPDARPSLVDLASVAVELKILKTSDVPRNLRPPPPPSH